MSIEIKVRAVEQLFNKLDKEIVTFQVQSSLHCISGCGKCCTMPEIEASPLEFLPWAFHLFLNGEAENVLDQLNIKTTLICHVYRPLSLVDNNNGSCGNYKYRGLICRLFGFAASRDKYGQFRLATCKIIKENQKENFENTENAISKGQYVPIFTDYYMRLSQIDFNLGKIIVPINKALKLAIEEILHYYAYRPLPTGHKNIV
ncbi:YkgJ family cysteine cluster protein [Urechidicola croceus]|uniref:Zinc/iron-chelating domain-containing protein n=1 Tax=Urechidicola croceus TaxID=1850246 RepID=A0A1D8P628_9FLAO|nr:YkgJ family cysteine cluster protein [Urechidicola croceus]AOW20026.1 hypothetical protein LPB138_04715 [Urechidicola croceus]